MTKLDQEIAWWRDRYREALARVEKKPELAEGVAIVWGIATGLKLAKDIARSQAPRRGREGGQGARPGKRRPS